MSDAKMVTEVEAVKRERAAFANGQCGRTPCAICLESAARAYPLPKITRPRVVKDERDMEWSVRDGALCVREPHLDDFRPAAIRRLSYIPTNERALRCGSISSRTRPRKWTPNSWCVAGTAGDGKNANREVGEMFGIRRG